MTKGPSFAATLKIGTAIAALVAAAPLYAQATPASEEEQAAAANEAAEQGAAQEDGETTEIVVTARRRAENLQDVPISVTALDGEALEDRGAVDLTAVMQQAPNTTLQIARGSNSTLIAFIRGVGQQDPLWGVEPGVGLYIDDVYVARPQGAVLDIFDVERIEVLRGPQGTLYGRNTIGGAVKYVTRRLGDEFAARGRASYGSYNQTDLVGSVTVPVAPTLSFGAAGAMLKRDGYGTNLTSGAEHYNKDVLAGRVSLEFTPTGDLFFRLAGDWIEDDSNARHGTRMAPISAALPLYQPLDDVYNTRAGAGDRNSVRTRGVSLTGEWQATADVTLKSITAYRDGDTDTIIDFDNGPEPRLDVPAFYEDDQLTQEFQLLYESDFVQGVAGVFYLDGHAAGAFDTVLGALNLSILTSGSTDTKSIGGFTDLSFTLTEQLRLSVGGRYTRDKRTGTVFRRNFTGIRTPQFGNSAAVPGLIRTNYTNTRTENQFTPRVSVSYLPNRDLTFYASYSKGYKSGGFDMRGDFFLFPETVEGYDPETVDAYEMGMKAYAAGGNLFFSLAGFYSDYKDQQITTQYPMPSGIASVFENAGDSRIKGLEAEMRATITDNFSMTAMLGLIDADFKRYLAFNPTLMQRVDVADQRVFQNTPKLTFGLTPTFSKDLAGGRLSFTPSISHRSAYSQFEIPNALLDEDGYTLVDASLVWT
ncbi:MAG TPA: TonB-dependent receptor, partial [Allosphingosinicella sp.]|nr:TonB-dependent receptor [Allosphingosinicella sp.]